MNNFFLSNNLQFIYKLMNLKTITPTKFTMHTKRLIVAQKNTSHNNNNQLPNY